TIRPKNIVDRPHRHVSAAVNYYFHGRGYSTVEGQRYEWEAGDLMLSAPGWAVHNHASKDEDVYELTIQDQPMHLALGSLLWHEDLRGEPKLLGLSTGFSTNRHVAQRIPVVAATGSQSLAETTELTARAEQTGADAVLVVTPYYIKPPQRGLIEYFVEIGKRTALPLMIYHIPGRAAVSITPVTIA